MTTQANHYRKQILTDVTPLRSTEWGTAISQTNNKVWLVGGVVRDLALDNESIDIDLAVEGDALAFGEMLADRLSARFVVLHENFGSCRIVLSDGRQLDITALQGKTIEDDLIRRDLTINAIALAWPGLDRIIDPTGGLNDLSARIARRCAPGVILTDPVRAIRVFRFAATLNLKIDSETMTELSQASHQLSQMPGERIWLELSRIFELDCSSEWIAQMDKSQTLDGLFPELAMTRGVMQPAFHHLDVHDHSIATVKNVAELIHDPILGCALIDPASRCVLRLAALLHDLGKPETGKADENDRLRFNAHDIHSAKIAEHACRRLRLSNELRHRVVRLVKAHMRPHQIADLLVTEKLSLKATRKFLLDLEDDWPLCLALARADLLATCGTQAPSDGEERSKKLAEYLQEAAKERLPDSHRPPLITGTDLLEMGIESGPQIGKLLEAVAQARFENPQMNKESALELVKTLHEK